MSSHEQRERAEQADWPDYVPGAIIIPARDVTTDVIWHQGTQPLKILEAKVGPDRGRYGFLLDVGDGKRQWVMHHGSDLVRVMLAPREPFTPRGGDAVRLAAPWPSAPDLPVGSIGVIAGRVDRPAADGRVSITFRARTYRDGVYVSCTGMPATVGTPVERLVRRDEEIELSVWRFRPGQSTTEEYTVTVPVWDFTPVSGD